MSRKARQVSLSACRDSLLHTSTYRIYLSRSRVYTIVKFVYSEKATKFGKISTLLLSTVHADKSKVEISQNFVAFSEYMNFMNLERNSLSHNSIGCWTKGICYLMLNKGMLDLDLVRSNWPKK